MNSTEQKIREAYEIAVEVDCCTCSHCSFEAGYLALLNELKPIVVWDNTTYYVLPEGLERP